ncbi:hypothetical protein THARTR1_01750 [Trichoderma harzianum]|uniref:Vacuolar sorting protein Vps3844 C-terminal domain-containing protein n=1 Tax=Trichoderma harzianum TaxID=5544 RepID=A0A2K0ULV6_TRIHA|nr:hypothetical protein THARTR1_01750 [Trichoderma harzianum]
MKLSLGIAAAFVSCAAASQPAADVYILPNRESASPPSIPSSIARLILLKLADSSSFSLVRDIPDDVDAEEVVSLMNRYGGVTSPLFDELAHEPKQLFITLQGLTEEQMKETRAKLQLQPSFTIPDAPYIDRLQWATGYEVPTPELITGKGTSCSYDEMTNPVESRCWKGKTLLAGFDIQKKPEYLNYVIDSFPRLTSLAEIGEVQTTFLFFPGAGKSSSQAQALHKRQAERVISHFHKTAAAVQPTSPAQNTLRAPAGRIPACFDSLDSCVSKTGNCSQQGECLNKYASADAGALASGRAPVCFACHCLSTRTEENGPLTHWAGPTCAKKDISVPFWLFAGFTLLMLGTISLSVTMLYNVGDEKLPGVIGAGVSKSK